ncbi:MAG: hypothetical protein GYA17_18270 [Chloroflexi bacterium]|nr:hypothetical protein [Chloroflexota bacterium]
MDSQYVLMVIGLTAGVVILMAYIYLTYRRGIAVTLGWLLCAFGFLIGAVTFFLGKEGMSPLRMLIALAVLMPVLIVIVNYLLRVVVKPVQQLTADFQALARGDLEQHELLQARHEIGQIVDCVRKVRTYQESMAVFAQSIADGRLDASLTLASEQDGLGKAMQHMQAGLHALVGQVTTNAERLSAAAVQLVESAEQASQSTMQISDTIQQVARASADQTVSIQHTSELVEEMDNDILGVVNGAQKQEQAIQGMSETTAQIATAIQEVNERSRVVKEQSGRAAQVARTGAKSVAETLQGMENIQNQVSVAAQKMYEMSRSVGAVGNIANTINEIASQTNLLALNAAIEAARVSSQSIHISQELLQSHLVSVGKLVAEIFKLKSNNTSTADLARLAEDCRISAINITDGDGTTIYSNLVKEIGYRFSDDPNEQSYEFRALLNRRDGVVVQPIQPRSRDNIPYLYVGVSRRDTSGIIQVGITADEISHRAEYGRGFAVVSEEVRRLAERAAASAKEIEKMLRGIQHTAKEAMAAMTSSAQEVENGVTRSHHSEKSLHDILIAVEQVQALAAGTAETANEVSAAVENMLSAVEAVANVVEQNRTAMQEMTHQSDGVKQAVSDFSALSEENSAAIEEVSASTQEVYAQIEELANASNLVSELTGQLSQAAQSFTLRE